MSENRAACVGPVSRGRGCCSVGLLLALLVAGAWPDIAGAQEPRASPTGPVGAYQPPPSCTRWFDGCNDCERAKGSKLPICTQRMCAPGTAKQGYCKASE
jgi:hypothetical protein